MNIYRSSSNKVIGGVCAGLADAFDLNVTGLRWAFALAAPFLSGIPVLVYLVLWAVLKERDTGDGDPARQIGGCAP